MRHLAACAKALETAPFLPGGWMAAVNAYAEAIGARGGQFVGRATASVETFHFVSPELCEAQDAWSENGGLDPVTSPMVRMGLTTPLLTPYTDVDALSGSDRRRNHLWQSVHERWNIPHVACTVLWREEGNQIVLAALRSAKQGPFEARDLRKQKALAARWREAIALTAALKGQANQLVVGALDAVQANIFLLDEFGRVAATTRGAERLTVANAWFKVRHGRLQAANALNQSALDEVIDRGVSGVGPASAELTGPTGVLEIQVVRLPAELDTLGFGATVLVICTRQIRIAALTRAEREIARALLQGVSLPSIADRRGTSMETVKAQAKAIYAKAGVRGQLELIERFAP